MGREVDTDALVAIVSRGLTTFFTCSWPVAGIASGKSRFGGPFLLVAGADLEVPAVLW